MVAEYQITIRLSAEEQALLDTVRGNTDLATYVASTALKAARRKAARVLPPHPLSDAELTPEEHLRLAAQAHEDGLEIDEFMRVVRERIAQRRAAHSNGANG